MTWSLPPGTLEYGLHEGMARRMHSNDRSRLVAWEDLGADLRAMFLRWADARVAEAMYADGLGDERELRQAIVADWVIRCFGLPVLASQAERGARLLEEALELAQAVGVPRATAATILDRVYANPPGDPVQEAGGVATTFLAACASLGVTAEACERQEMERILARPVEHFRQRHAAKEAAGMMVVPQQSVPVDGR